MAASFFPDGVETRTLYYLKDKSLIQFNHKEWQKNTAPPMAKEIVSYIDDKGIFLTYERSVKLEQDEKPGDKPPCSVEFAA